MFYVAPLFLIALLLWIQRGAPRPRDRGSRRARRRGSAGRDAAVPAADRRRRSRPTRSRSCRGGGCRSTGSRCTTLRLVATLCALGAAALFLARAAALDAVALPVLVLVYFCVVQQPVRGAHGARIAQRALPGHRRCAPDWIDRARRTASDVAAFCGRGAPTRMSCGRTSSSTAASGRSTTSRQPSRRPRRRRPSTSEPSASCDGQTARRARRFCSRRDARPARHEPSRPTPKRRHRLAVRPAPLASVTRVSGLYPDDSWSGPVVVYRRPECAGGRCASTLLGDPNLFRAATDRARERRHARCPSRSSAPASLCRCDRVRRALPRLADEGAGRRRPAPARHPLPDVRVHAAMRIAFDVSPLSHPRAGIGNYMLGALRGLVENGADVVAFAPVSVRGKAQRRAGARGNRRRAPAARAAVRARVAHCVVAPRPAGDGAVARPLRRAALLGLDVPAADAPACARRRSTTSFRCASRSGRTDAPFACTARSTGTRRETAHVLVCNSEFTARDVRELLHVPAERVRVAHPAAGAASSRARASAPTSGGRTRSRSRRSSRGRTWRRCSTRTSCSTGSLRSPLSAPPGGARSRASTGRA